MATPKVILDDIVKDGEVKDVMLLRKAAVAFANLTVKGYVGNRFAFVNGLKTDMAKQNSIPMSVMTQVQSSMETWDSTMSKFKTFLAKEGEWTVGQVSALGCHGVTQISRRCGAFAFLWLFFLHGSQWESLDGGEISRRKRMRWGNHAT